MRETLRCAMTIERDAVMRERKFRAVDRPAAAGDVEHARQNPHASPAIGRLLEQHAASANGEDMMLGQALCLQRARFLQRQRRRVFCAAESAHRDTRRTLG